MLSKIEMRNHETCLNQNSCECFPLLFKVEKETVLTNVKKSNFFFKGVKYVRMSHSFSEASITISFFKTDAGYGHYRAGDPPLLCLHMCTKEG